jgi:hypothetical protein
MGYIINSDVTYKSTTQLDAFGRLRVSNPYTLYDSQQRFEIDDTFVSNTAVSGSITYIPTQCSCNLTVVNSTGSYVARETKYIFQYQPGKSLLSLSSFVMAPQSNGNLRQRVGYFGKDNGFYLELSDQLYVVQRSNITGTVSNTLVANTSWNYDKLDGTGVSGYNLDITKAQIFWTDIEWLGVGDVRCGFLLDRKFVIAHIFKHSNISSSAYMTTACLPLRYEIQSLASGGSATANLTQVCSTVISEGGQNQPLRLYSNLCTFSKTVNANTWIPIMSVKLEPGRLDAVVQVKQVEIILSTTDTVQWALWSNVTAANLTGASFALGAPSNTVQVDKTATAVDVTHGRQIAGALVTNSVQNVPVGGMLELGSYLSQIGRNSFTQTSFIFTLCIFSDVSAATVSGTALLNWQEVL